MSPDDAINWAHNLSKVTSTVHKDLILRLAHGELYYRERLFRYNLVDSPLCPRCMELETLEHKFATCSYVAAIWQTTTNLTMPSHRLIMNLDTKDKILGTLDASRITLTIHGEIIKRIRHLKADQNYCIHPKILLRHTLEHLKKKEKETSIKTELADLLQQLG